MKFKRPEKVYDVLGHETEQKAAEALTTLRRQNPQLDVELKGLEKRTGEPAADVISEIFVSETGLKGSDKLKVFGAPVGAAAAGAAAGAGIGAALGGPAGALAGAVFGGAGAAGLGVFYTFAEMQGKGKRFGKSDVTYSFRDMSGKVIPPLGATADTIDAHAKGR